MDKNYIESQLMRFQQLEETADSEEGKEIAQEAANILGVILMQVEEAE